MKRINNIFIYTLIVLICFVTAIGIVKAEECTLVEKNELKSKASNIRINYITGTKDVEGKDYDGSTVSAISRYIDIKIFNITSDLFVRIKSSGDNVNIEEKLMDYHNMGPDGSITIRIPALDVVSDYTFEIFSYSTNCRGEVLRTIRLTIPKYNSYSQLEACKDNKDFYLCQEYITFNIDKDNFYKQIDEYKEKGGANADVLINEANALNKIVNPNSKLRFVVVGLLLVGGIIATYFIVKKNRKKSQLWK